MALQLLALVTVNWLFFFFRSHQNVLQPCLRGGTRQGFTPVTKTELPMPLELSRTPIPLRLGVMFCLFMSFFLNDGTKTVGQGPLLFFFLVLPALPIVQDVLRFLFIIPETLWSGTGPNKKRQFVLERLVPFQIKYFDYFLNKKFMEETRKMDFLSNLRKKKTTNLRKCYLHCRDNRVQAFFCSVVCVNL